MASSELTDLTAVTTIGGDEVLYIVDNPGTTPVDRKITVTNLLAGKQDASADLTDLVARSAPASAGLPSILAFPENTTNGTSSALLIGPNSAAADYNVTLPATAGTLALQSAVDAIPDLAAANPAEVQLVTASGTTTLTLLSTIARLTDIPASSSIVYSTPLASNSAAKNANTTLGDVTGMSVALAASSVYDLFVYCPFQSGTTGDIKLGWTCPSGATGAYGGTGPAAAGATDMAINFVTFPSGQQFFGGAGVGTSTQATMQGVIRTSSAGTLQLQMAQSSSEAVDTTIRAQAFIRAIKIS